MKKILFPLIFLLLLSSCGTYSVLRPADVLEKGEFEISGGLAVNSLPEGVPVAILSYGINNKLEANIQYEVYSALIGARYEILNSEDDRVALAIGLHAGYVYRFIPEKFRLDGKVEEWMKSTIVTPGITIGKRKGKSEWYLAYKAFIDPTHDYWYEIGTIKIGYRYTLFKNIAFGIEGGASHHRCFENEYYNIFEGTAGFSKIF